MEQFAYVYVLEAACDWRRAARKLGITPLLARQICDSQPEWTMALDTVRLERIRETGTPKITALHRLAEQLVCHPQEEMLRLQATGLLTAARLDAELSQTAKDCLEQVKFDAVDEWIEEEQIYVSVQAVVAWKFKDLPGEAMNKVLDAEGVKGVKLMPVDEKAEPVKGFGGMVINFVNERVD
jgi:hypothetical protein